MELIRKIKSRRDKKGILRSYALFWCDYCKQEVERPLSYIKCKSCGCNKKYDGIYNSNYKHGGNNTKLWMVWRGIKARCLNPKHKFYKDYGGRGITICPEWTDIDNGFINFRNWSLNNGYQEGLEINRKENDGNYSPENCNFITHKENCNNRRGKKINWQIANEIRIKYNSGYYTQQKISNEYKISQTLVSQIILNKIWYKG